MTKTNQEILEQRWREDWFEWLMFTGRFGETRSKDYLFKIIDEGKSGWKDSLDSYLAARKAAEIELEDLRECYVRKDGVLFDREQEMIALKAENEQVKLLKRELLWALGEMNLLHYQKGEKALAMLKKYKKELQAEYGNSDFENMGLLEK